MPTERDPKEIVAEYYALLKKLGMAPRRGRPTRGYLEERRNKDGTISFIIRAQIDGKETRETVVRVRPEDRDKGRSLAEWDLAARRLAWRGGKIDQMGQAATTWKQATTAYGAHAERHLAPSSARRYRAVLENAATSDKFPSQLGNTTSRHVHEYLTYRRHEMGRAATGVNYELDTLRRFWRWCQAPSRAWVSHDPFEGVHPMTVEDTGRRGRTVLTAGEISKFRKVVPPHVWNVFDFDLNTGLRLAELQYLDVDDVDPRARVIRVIPKLREGHRIKSQGASNLIGKERMVALSDQALAAWSRQHGWRSAQGAEGSIAFPAPNKGGRWTKLGDSVRYYMKRAKVNASIHTARHTFCTNALRHTKDLHAVMVMMGHDDIKTTMQYLHFLPDHTREAMRDFAGTAT